MTLPPPGLSCISAISRVPDGDRFRRPQRSKSQPRSDVTWDLGKSRSATRIDQAALRDVTVVCKPGAPSHQNQEGVRGIAHPLTLVHDLSSSIVGDHSHLTSRHQGSSSLPNTCLAPCSFATSDAVRRSGQQLARQEHGHHVAAGKKGDEGRRPQFVRMLGRSSHPPCAK